MPFLSQHLLWFKFLFDENSQVIITQLCLCYNVIDDIKDINVEPFHSL